VYGYVYLSSGALRTNTPEKYPSRQQQLRNLRATKGRLAMTQIAYEKVPKVTGLRSLPTLMLIIGMARREKTQVVMDDVRRIFYRCPRDQREKLLEQIRPFLGLIRDLRHEEKLLSELDAEAWKTILTIERPPSFDLLADEISGRPKAKRARQTAVARRVSAQVRSKRSDVAAARIAKLSSELLAERGSITLKQIADAANEKGLRTTRRNLWTEPAISCALKRHAKHENKNEPTEDQSPAQ
jgi:hypothetical protein